MLFFRNDYSVGAHPQVMEALCKTNLELTVGYGLDPYCQKATELIRNLCRCNHADVHFIVGGTQANKTALGAFLWLMLIQLLMQALRQLLVTSFTSSQTQLVGKTSRKCIATSGQLRLASHSSHGRQKVLLA